MGYISKLAPKTCRVIQREEFEYVVVSSDGETIGIYGNEERAEAVKNKRNEMFRDEYMRAWRK